MMFPFSVLLHIHLHVLVSVVFTYISIDQSVLKNLFFYSTVNLLHSLHKKTLKKDNHMT